MNARDNSLEHLKHELTTGSRKLFLCGETLQRISAVTRVLQNYPQLQMLGVLTQVPTVPFPRFNPGELEPRAPASVAPEEKPVVETQPQDTVPPAVAVPPQVQAPIQLDPVCSKCQWRYPVTFTLSDRQRHSVFADRGECARDRAAFHHRAERKSRQLQDRERLMNGGERGVDVQTCPHCDRSLEGCWGEFKRQHLRECEAKNLDRELSSIVNTSPLIPKKRVVEDSFAIAFTSMRKRLRTAD